MSFTHLHVATAFSAHYGVSWPDDLAAGGGSGRRHRAGLHRP